MTKQAKQAVPMKERTDHKLLEVTGLGKHFSLGTGAATHAIGDVSLSVADGEFVAIVGPSGCGKTTLLRCLSGLLRPDQGQVRYAGQPVNRVPSDLAIVFQEYNRSLFPWLTVRRNVEFGLSDLPRAVRRERAREALERVRLEGFADHFPWQLSGGMQQRVAIARAIALHPRVLLMDEPFASVDAQTRTALEEMTASISAALGLTTLLITHDIDEAIFMADRVVVLSARPSRVVAELPVDIPRPRDELAVKALPEFSDLRRRIHDLIGASPAAEA
ncbi:ABC transporter ATP-binding protein [Streptomyces sp. NPDC048825]|uniref:ABC transporter ATP-binding protein n=1 Tax=Streptomyces sp. NPDC048825 TaxID=3365592 RepID=UPI003715CEE3